MRGRITFGSLADVLEHLRKARHATKTIDVARAGAEWSPFQVLSHCAQSIEMSLAGYPKPKPLFVQKTIGRIVLRRFLAKGQMRHDLAGPIPGAPALDASGTTADGAARLVRAIESFHAFGGPLAPHFVYGKVTRGEYDKVHAMHCADHFSALDALA